MKVKRKNPFRFIFKRFVRDIKEEGHVLFISLLFLFAVHDKRFYTSFKKYSLKHAKLISNFQFRKGFHIPTLFRGSIIKNVLEIFYVVIY